jgi:macrolide transport system ATP-binding/permease protein
LPEGDSHDKSMSLVNKIRSLLRRGPLDGDLDEEVRFHIEAKTRDYIAAGMTRGEAREAALRDFGRVEQTKEECRDMRGTQWIENFWQDLRYGLRVLRKSPGFTAAVVLTLALGIGANTAIFTLIDAVMLKLLPVANPRELYRLGDNNNCCVMEGTQNGGSFVLYSYELYKELRDHTPEFSGLAAFEPWTSDLSVRHNGSAAQPYKGEFVSGNYFNTLGVRAFAGRLLAPPDDSASAPRVAVMNYHTWQQRFGLDPSVIGSTVDINGVACLITGVTPPRFYGDTLRSDPPDFWLPLAGEPERWRLQSEETEFLYLIGRLKPGERPEPVQVLLTVELQQWLGSHSEVIPQRDREDIPQQHIRLTPAAGGVEQMQTDYATGLRLLLTLSSLLLLIACANIANLLLARGSANRPQMAVRLALGATRTRLMRQMLTESLLLAIAGGLAGLYVAYAGAHAILLLAFRGAQYVPIDARPSPPVLGFSLFVSVATGIIFGIAPAWMASQCDPAGALRIAGRSISDRSSRLQKPLLIAQVAFSIVLLIGAGLVTQSLRNLEDQNFGFVTGGRLIVTIDPALSGYTENKLYGLYQRLQEALPQIPGVLSASLSGYSPLDGNNWNEWVFIEGKRQDYRGTAPSWDRVGPHYFETIGTRLLQGRAIDQRDTPGAPNVAVINETFARRFFPNENPIGHRFGMGDESHSGDYQIVGIVEDAKYQDTRRPAYATFFLPLVQIAPGTKLSGWANAIELRVAGKPENLEPAVRKALADVDPNLTVVNMVSFGEQVARNFNQERLIARLAELFGALALILACVGLYGVTAYGVARRTNEIGIRIALGAERRNVLGLVLRTALAQLGLGLAIGIPAALAGGRLLAHELYGVQSYDPTILGAASLVFAACAILAALIPARRATRVDPMIALRYE